MVYYDGRTIRYPNDDDAQLYSVPVYVAGSPQLDMMWS